MYHPAGYLDLYDYRLRVSGMYRERNRALEEGEDPAGVLERFRRQRDDLFATHPQSALDGESKQQFQGLSYFPYNPDACVEASVDPEVEPQEVMVSTSGEERMPLRRVAEVRFLFADLPATLSLYWIEVYGGGLFLPFHDATAPAETYGGGRYLFDTVKGSDFLLLPERDGERRILLDFNYAYNPSCAYSPHWVCPLAPPGNRLAIPIRAGERRFVGPGDSS